MSRTDAATKARPHRGAKALRSTHLPIFLSPATARALPAIFPPRQTAFPPPKPRASPGRVWISKTPPGGTATVPEDACRLAAAPAATDRAACISEEQLVYEGRAVGGGELEVLKLKMSGCLRDLWYGCPFKANMRSF